MPRKTPLCGWMIRQYLKLLMEVRYFRPRTILGFGCGEGIIARTILKEQKTLGYIGVESSEETVYRARQRNSAARFAQTDQTPGSQPERADLVIYLALLEHLTNPEKLLETLLQAAHRSAIVRVRWIQFIQLGSLCRGLYLSCFGTHLEHIPPFNKRSLRHLLNRPSLVVRIDISFSWLFTY